MWTWQPTGGWAWEFPPMRARLSDRPRKKGEGDDGDTVLMVLDQGLNGHQEEAVRLAGVFAPESHEAGGKEMAKFTAMALAEVVERATAHQQRWPFVVFTEKVAGAESSQRRSFVRWVGTVYAMDTGECVNEEIAAYVAAHPEWGRGIGADSDG
jgi:hypothetical protein